MPKHNFSYGFEIRAYLESLAARYGLDENAMYRTKVESAVWDDSTKRWVVTLHKTISNGPPKTIKVRARFLSFFPGVHVYQKLPAIPGISSYSGQQFHIARWDYSVTGGTEEEPVLDKLRDKRVAIIGNGCSGVQGIAEVAKYAKELYVMQRTPASVDIRDQRPTDPAEWAEISKDENWWDTRCRNMADTLSGALKPGEPQLVDDYTVGVTTYRVVFGGKAEGLTPEGLPSFITKLHAEDLPRMERIRKIVTDTVKDPETAAKLIPWFTSWCKRPVFHDYYYEVFNQPNVHLVDDEKGVRRITPKGFVANDTEYPVDVIIWATGYRGPFVGFPEERAGMEIIGRDGRHLDDKWRENVATLHASMTEGFPNLLLMGLFQGGMTLSHSTVMDCMAKHEAYIARQARERAGGRDFAVEPTTEAEESWSQEVIRYSLPSAALGGCTRKHPYQRELDKLWLF
jgi:cation diffusion facilitator CzcD-associated flavoprotein CzcO